MTAKALHGRFVELLERHQRIVSGVTGMYCRNVEDRRDLAQEIAVQLWSAFPGYDPQASFSTWMYRIALNVAISHLRKTILRAKYTEPVDENADHMADLHEDAAERDDRVRVLQRFIASLDEMNRALLLLYLEEHSYRSMAEVLGISETNVATKISRLKQRLRDTTGR
jgi:RNA polymerase sigma factor (sigma-70 family)